MKKIFVLLVVSFLIAGCNAGTVNYRNPNLPANYMVYMQLNLALPLYSNLKNPINSFVDYSQGIRGVVVFNAGNSYVAYDLACPNTPYTTCATAMTVMGVDAKCSCDNSTYSLFSGQSTGQQYPMKPYHVELNGDNLTVTN